MCVSGTGLFTCKLYFAGSAAGLLLLCPCCWNDAGSPRAEQLVRGKQQVIAGWVSRYSLCVSGLTVIINNKRLGFKRTNYNDI